MSQPDDPECEEQDHEGGDDQLADGRRQPRGDLKPVAAHAEDRAEAERAAVGEGDDSGEVRRARSRGAGGRGGRRGTGPAQGHPVPGDTPAPDQPQTRAYPPSPVEPPAVAETQTAADTERRS